jgi:hypothetical protein
MALKVASMMTAFWDIVQSSLTGRSCPTSMNSYETTQCNFAEGSQLKFKSLIYYLVV